jgi:hypothetical protein
MPTAHFFYIALALFRICLYGLHQVDQPPILSVIKA